jgi:hypothetical protein
MWTVMVSSAAKKCRPQAAGFQALLSLCCRWGCLTSICYLISKWNSMTSLICYCKFIPRSAEMMPG